MSTSNKHTQLAQTIVNMLMIEERSLSDVDAIYDVMETLGHREEDIGAAVSFLESIPSHSAGLIYRSGQGITYPSKSIGKILNAEAKNILSLMEQFNVLDNHTIEDILDRVEMASFEKGDALDLDEMKGIINHVILDNITLGVEDMVRMANEPWGTALH
ncbi:hypothetical protein Selin_0250 [Desulfurispirillum indicum S5]|uniref:Uncharacterized protein n=1 Tax=Desulfurispirillum indicum (strain ATCC BAA-1389 / DSM 22839 / S5) TaxID=653733 RepID=E6W6K6_DESIS|nr:DUF494 family protein [Desulfurispirillum indicum]ADU65006.1 hypothetical protein Selin_0250 [Desulfurispirillum indicum S5]